MRWQQLDVILAVDPLYLTGRQSSTDLMLQWRTSHGLAPLLGWRLTTIGLSQGAQFQQNLLLGLGADLPRF